MRAIYIAVLLAFFVTSTAADAMGALPPRNHGRWLCEACSFNPNEALNVVADGINFIKATQIIKRGDGYRPGDRVSVCNGTYCQEYIYQASGQFLPLGLVTNDPHRGYRNDVAYDSSFDSSGGYVVQVISFDPPSTQYKMWYVDIGPIVPVSEIYGPASAGGGESGSNWGWGSVAGFDDSPADPHKPTYNGMSNAAAH